MKNATTTYIHHTDNDLNKMGNTDAADKRGINKNPEIEKEKRKLGIKEKLDPVGKEDGDIDNDGDKDDSDKYLAKRRKAISKAIKKDQKEELDKEDKPTVQKVVKMLKKASKAHADQSKSLEKDLQDNVDKTLDRIRESNVEKSKYMRSILADIWKVNEGKNPFAKDEGVASDAQR